MVKHAEDEGPEDDAVVQPEGASNDPFLAEGVDKDTPNPFADLVKTLFRPRGPEKQKAVKPPPSSSSATTNIGELMAMKEQERQRILSERIVKLPNVDDINDTSIHKLCAEIAAHGK